VGGRVGTVYVGRPACMLIFAVAAPLSGSLPTHPPPPIPPGKSWTKARRCEQGFRGTWGRIVIHPIAELWWRNSMHARAFQLCVVQVQFYLGQLGSQVLATSAWTVHEWGGGGKGDRHRRPPGMFDHALDVGAVLGDVEPVAPRRRAQPGGGLTEPAVVGARAIERPARRESDASLLHLLLKCVFEAPHHITKLIIRRRLCLLPLLCRLVTGGVRRPGRPAWW
jgi:hypothetical protein